MVLGLREFLERPAGELGDDVVAGGGVLFEAAVAPVGDLVEGDPGRELGRNARDREAGRLARERARTAGARVDLDDDGAPVLGVVGELDVGAARDADRVDDPVAVVLQLFLDLFRHGEHRGDAEAVAGVDSHRVDVFDEADGDLVALGVADDLELELLPAEDALFDKHLTDQTGGETAGDDFAQLFDVVDDAAAGAAHRVGRAEHHRVAEFGGDLLGLFDRVAGLGFRHGHAERRHRLLEFDPVFAALDRVEVDADDLDVILVEHARLLERDREVERGLAAEVRQQRVGAFAFDDPFDARGVERFDVGVIRHAGVGHDRRGVGVRQHHFVALFAQGFARLGARVVELARLTDDDGTGTDDEDLSDVVALRHKILAF